MKKLIDGVRFSEDIRYFTWLKEKAIVRRVKDHIIQECFDMTADQDFLNQSVRVSSQIAPKLYSVFSDTKERLELQNVNISLYIKKGNEINAVCARSAEDSYVIYLTSALIEKMSDEQIAFVIGHEFGHAVYGHHEFPVHQILNSLEEPNYEVIEDILRWSRMAEISADRVGLINCRDINAAIGAILVLTTGLPSTILAVDPKVYGTHAKSLIERLAKKGEVEDLYGTHPFNPLRVMGLNLFWRSSEMRSEFDCDDILEPLQNIDAELKSLFEDMEGEFGLGSKIPEPNRAYERKKTTVDDVSSSALMWGCVCVAASDGKIHDLEVEAISQWLLEADVSVELNRLNTSNNALNFAIQQLEKTLPDVLKTSPTNRCAMLQKFVIVARADGEVQDTEKEMLINLCNMLEIPKGFYSKILKYL